METRQRVIDVLKRFVIDVAEIDKSLPWNNGHPPDWWEPLMRIRTTAYKMLGKLKEEVATQPVSGQGRAGAGEGRME